jgi:glycosyltransferase involved in cell wall biosynthesis
MVRAAFERAGARVVHVNTQDRRSVFNTGVLDVKNVLLGLVHAGETALLAARERPDVAYIPISQGRWGYVRDAVMMAVLRVQRRPFVAHLRGSQLQDFYAASTAAERAMIRRTLGWSALAIALTPSLRNVYDGLVPPERVRILENAIVDPYPGGIDELAEARRTRAAESPRALRILYLANDWSIKGAMTLVRALGHPGLEEVEVRMAGAPLQSQIDEARAEAERLGAGARLTMVGSVSGAAKAREFAWADVLVHPSEADGQPVVVIEAMAAGLPVVASTFGGIPDTVGDAGMLVEPRVPEQLGAAVRSLIDDPGLRLRLGEAGRERFLARYTPDRYQERFVELFAELIPLPCVD